MEFAQWLIDQTFFAFQLKVFRQRRKFLFLSRFDFDYFWFFCVPSSHIRVYAQLAMIKMTILHSGMFRKAINLLFNPALSANLVHAVSS
jgi:hypothetical protein